MEPTPAGGEACGEVTKRPDGPESGAWTFSSVAGRGEFTFTSAAGKEEENRRLEFDVSGHEVLQDPPHTARTPSFATPDIPRVPSAPVKPGLRSGRQAHRYLHQTLAKLSEDSVRIGRATGEAPPNVEWPGPLHRAAAAAERAAPPAAAASPAALGGSTTVASSPRVLLPIPARGERLEAKRQQSSPQKSAAILRSLTEELEAYDGSYNLPRAILHVAKVIANWEGEVRATSERWGKSLAIHMQWQKEGEERWENLHGRLDSMGQQLARLEEAVRDTGSKEEALEGVVRESIQSITQDHRDALASAQVSLQKSIACGTESLQRHVTDLVTGKMSDTVDEQKAMQASIGDEVRVMKEMLARHHEKEEEWKVQLAALRDQALEADQRTQQEQACTAALHGQVQRMERSAMQLEEEMERMRRLVEKVCHAPATDALKQITAIAGRGNLQLNWQTGRAELRRNVEFTSAVGVEGKPGFTDPDFVKSVAVDLADLSRLFKVPIHVDLQVPAPSQPPQQSGGKKAASAKGDALQVGKNQAAVLQSFLEEGGVPAGLLTVTASLLGGKQAQRGAPPTTVKVQLQPELFNPPRPEGAGTPRPRSPSPRAKSPNVKARR